MGAVWHVYNDVNHDTLARHATVDRVHEKGVSSMSGSLNSAAPAWTGADLAQSQTQGATSGSRQFMSMLDRLDADVRAPLHGRLEMDAKTQAILTLSMVAGQLQTHWIPAHVRQCVQAGLGRTEVGETLMHVYCYAGVYPSISGFKVAAQTLDELEAAGALTPEQCAVRNEPPPTQTYEDRIAHGLQIRRELFGGKNITPLLDAADAFDNLFNDMTHDFCFGNIWARPTFGWPLRSQLCLAIASATGQIGAVERHTRSAVNNGLSQSQIGEIFLLAYVYGGAGNAMAAFDMARSVFATMAAEAAAESAAAS